MRKRARSVMREYYGLPDERLLPEVSHVGWTDLTHSRPIPLGRHRHEEAFEICYVYRGHVDWWAEKKVYEVPHHHLYVTQPDEWHGGVDSVLHPCELFWIGVAVPAHGTWPGLSAAETRTVHARLSGIRERVFPAPTEITSRYRAILAEHRDRGTHAELAARAELHGLLVAVLRAYDRHEAGRIVEVERISAATQAAMEFAGSHLAQDIGVSEMARAAKWSVSRFHSRFVRETGETPAEWLRRQRVLRAKQLLLTTRRSVTTLAHELGFPSSQYFATVFSRYTGLTPSAYRERGEQAGT